ncbi:MAG: RDD family protein, partial [Paludibacteraceae bacterium]|nr:RDD family protein [Paludibacteraceae bacterium]
FVIMTNACGATVGKMIMSIKVVSIEDRRPTFTEIIYRETVGRFLSSAIMNIGYLMIFPTKEKTALHDILSDTRVIYVHMEERYRMRPSRNVKEYGVNTSVMPPEGIFNGNQVNGGMGNVNQGPQPGGMPGPQGRPNGQPMNGNGPQPGGMPGPNPGPQNGGMPGVGGNPQMGGRPGMPGGPNGQPMNGNGAQMGGRPGMPGGPKGQSMNENGAQMGGRPGMPNENLMNGRPDPMMYMPKSDFKPQRSINSTNHNVAEEVSNIENNVVNEVSNFENNEVNEVSNFENSTVEEISNLESEVVKEVSDIESNVVEKITNENVEESNLNKANIENPTDFFN